VIATLRRARASADPAAERTWDQRAGDADSALDDLTGQAASWATAEAAEVRQLTAEAVVHATRIAPHWVRACADEKRSGQGPAQGEEWALGPLILVRYLRTLVRALDGICAHGQPDWPSASRPAPGGRVAVPVFPQLGWDRLLLPRFRADVWLEPGLGESDARSQQAASYRRSPEPKLCVVLGAGNVSAIPATDAVEQLVVHRRVVLLKTSPVQDYLVPLLESALQPFLERGVLRVVDDAADADRLLLSDMRVDAVHMTGSQETFAKVVQGSVARPVPLTITAELGNVTPVIVMPGAWSAADIDYQAQNVAGMVVNNGGYNCAAARVLVTSADWPQRQSFLDALRVALSRIPSRFAYYPGAPERLDEFLRRYPPAECIGDRSEGRLPWVLIAGLDADADQLCFTTEPFAPVVGETALDSGPDFLASAVRFCNERLAGDLAASILVHPRSVPNGFDEAIAALQYGTVAVNHWSAVAYSLGSAPWGAFRGGGMTVGPETSGSGFVHNTLMLAGVEKTVLRGPFRVRPTPMWFPCFPRRSALSKRTLALQARPGLARLAAVIAAAIGPKPRTPACETHPDRGVKQ
jgi:hypothetical protein